MSVERDRFEPLASFENGEFRGVQADGQIILSAIFSPSATGSDARVEYSKGQDVSIHVQVDPSLLEPHGITVQDNELMFGAPTGVMAGLRRMFGERGQKVASISGMFKRPTQKDTDPSIPEVYIDPKKGDAVEMAQFVGRELVAE